MIIPIGVRVANVRVDITRDKRVNGFIRWFESFFEALALSDRSPVETYCSGGNQGLQASTLS